MVIHLPIWLKRLVSFCLGILFIYYDDYYKYIRPEDWLTNSKRSEAPSGEQRVASAPLPPTPSPDSKVVQSSPQVNQNVLPNGLTRTETALLRPEEQLMKLNQRQQGQV